MERSNPKFASQAGDHWPAHDYGPVFASQTTPTQQRLCIAASQHGSRLLSLLAAKIVEPFYLLYVLVVPRGRSEAGRYQSPELSREELNAFLERFGVFWDSDGRHSVWIHSPGDQATLVYDRHNLIYGYGRVAVFEAVLTEMGFQRVNSITVPLPHQPAYVAGFDDLERDLVSQPGWRRTGLTQQDSE